MIIDSQHEMVEHAEKQSGIAADRSKQALRNLDTVRKTKF